MTVTFREDLDDEFNGHPECKAMRVGCSRCGSENLSIYYDGDGSVIVECEDCEIYVTQIMVARRPVAPGGVEEDA